jgi:hypothetical protein
LTAVFFLNRRDLTRRAEIAVFSGAKEIQEGFSATGGHYFGPRGPTRLHAFDFFASTLIQ